MPININLDGGGESPIGPIFEPNPASLAFGDISDAAFKDLSIVITNTGDLQLTYTGVFSGPNAALFTVQTGTLSRSLSPGASATLEVRCSMTGGNGAKTASIDFTGNGVNLPVSIPLTANGVNAGTKVLVVDPLSWDFGSGKLGVASANKVFSVYNSGTVAVTVTGVTVNGPFEASGLPVFPIVLAPQVGFAEGGFFAFNGRYKGTAEGLQRQANGFVVASDAAAGAINVELTGTGYLITPVHTVEAINYETVLGFCTTPGVAAVRTVDEGNLNCEEEASFKQVYDLQINSIENPVMPQQEKTLLQVGFRYEDLGVCDVTMNTKSKRILVEGDPAEVTSNTDALKLGTAAADSWPYNKLGNTDQGNDMIEIEVVRAANAGAFSITEIFPRFQPGGEYIENT